MAANSSPLRSREVIDTYHGLVRSSEFTLRRSLALVGCLAVAVFGMAAAGSSSASASEFKARITVVVSMDGGKTKERSEITCPGFASRACRSLKLNGDVLWPDHGRICTEIYGGPQRARIRGEVDGRLVDVIIQRNNGCGIDDWDALRGVLPRI